MLFTHFRMTSNEQEFYEEAFMKNITECLEQTVKCFPDKTAFRDDVSELTYFQLMSKAKSIGTALAGLR